MDFDTPDKAKDETTAKLFEYAKQAKDQGFLFSPHAFADTCPKTRENMLDTALELVREIRQKKVYNFAGEGTLPEGYENKGQRKPEGIIHFQDYLQSKLQPSKAGAAIESKELQPSV